MNARSTEAARGRSRATARPLIAALLLAWGTGAIATPLGGGAWRTPTAALPYWLLGDERCSATLITSRVAVTTYDCQGDVGRQRHTMQQRSTGEHLTGRLLTDRPRRGVTAAEATRLSGRPLALFLLDAPPSGLPGPGTFATGPLPTYREEAELVRDRAVNPAWLSGHVPSPSIGADDVAPPRATEMEGHYVRPPAMPDRLATAERRLVYRSVSALRAAEPGRFDLSGDGVLPDDGPGPDILGRLLRSRMNGHVVPDAVLDDLVLTTVGDAADGITRLWSETARQALLDERRLKHPFGTLARGVGLMASRGTLSRLVGVVTDPSGVHWRLSAFWPAIYRALLDQGLREDARALASRLLEQQSPSFVGKVSYYDNPHSGRIEFFRRVAASADGHAAPFPTDGHDNEHWEYLGTELPASREVLAPLRVWRVEELDPPIGKRYVRFNGITRQVEYFRLKAHDRDGRAPVLPSAGASDAHWTYEGTDLKVRKNPFADWTPASTAGTIVPAATVPPAAPMAPLSPLPGTGPALPAPEAAR
ncbi:hypothetical protein [Roseateles sp. L2-2]|uniref:hypothetical protein n=1 Tax=Roseateles sp. L2-2 TaxID=3422597 RepID=UPI003D35E608